MRKTKITITKGRVNRFLQRAEMYLHCGSQSADGSCMVWTAEDFARFQENLTAFIELTPDREKRERLQGVADRFIVISRRFPRRECRQSTTEPILAATVSVPMKDFLEEFALFHAPA